MLRYLPGLLALGFALYCIIDLVRSSDDEVRGLPRLVWLLLMIVLPVLGGIAWLVAGRPRSSRPPGRGPLRPRPSSAVRGPDDDPDFLRSLDGTVDRTSDVDDGGDGTADDDRS